MYSRTRKRQNYPNYTGYFGLTVLAVLAASLMACTDGVVDPAQGPAAPANASATVAATALPAQAQGPQWIGDQYIVVFNDDVRDVPGLARALAQKHGGSVNYTYDAALKGFSAQLPAVALLGLQHNPNIALIEQDQMAMTTGVQAAATWGLDRVDQSLLPLDSRYSYAGTGAGVHVYIIDSGIRSTHSEFTGRVGSGTTFISDGNGTEDCMGHGSHVAGTVAGSTYGVAKGATLHPVRVFGCSGGTAYSTIIAAVDWVTANHMSPAVANMSLGGGISYALNGAVQTSIKAGVTYAVAAGNSATNACYYSPASTPEAITVAASTSDDTHAPFSNSGSCVDVYGPGTYITSAWFGSDSDVRVASGTSMASPHVAGAAAVYLELHPGAAPATVANAIVGSATSGRISPKMTNTNNSLLNTTALAVHNGEAPSSGGGGNGGNGGTGNGKGKGNKK